jgi:hypothetical protein
MELPPTEQEPSAKKAQEESKQRKLQRLHSNCAKVLEGGWKFGGTFLKVDQSCRRKNSRCICFKVINVKEYCTTPPT